MALTRPRLAPVMRSLLAAALGATMTVTLTAPSVQAASLASTTATAPTTAGGLVSSAAVAAAPSVGPRTATGCTEDGVSGKRVQVIYAVSSESPDRYAENVSDFQGYLREVDSIFQQSALINGGGTRQVRWVHDADCRPVIKKMVVPPVVNADGTKRQVYGTMGDTYTTLKAAGLSFTDLNRKYILLVDYPGDGWDDPICGISFGLYSSDSSPGLSNRNNMGGSYARVDTQCWPGSLDSSNYERESTITHELAHTLGAVTAGAPHSTPTGHCSDNADIMCYEDASSGPMREVCAPADKFENLLDCNGDDYFNTNPTSSNWLYTHWNVADSSFLYAPGPPTLTASTSAIVPGQPSTITLPYTVPSGQGWRADYSVPYVTPFTIQCTLSRTSSTSADTGGVSTRVLCPAAATQVNLQAKLTQEDGQTVTVTTRLTPASTARTTSSTVTASTSSAAAGSPVTFTAKVTDPQTQTGIYGIPVQFTLPTGFNGASSPTVLTATTDPTGTATVTTTATPPASTTVTVTATTDTVGAWQPSAASTALAVVAAPSPTALTLTAPTGYVTPGSVITLAGTLTTTGASTGPVAGQGVQLWQTQPGPATQVAATTTGPDGAVSFPVAVAADRTFELRFPASTGYLASTSPAAAVSVTRATSISASVSAGTVPAGTPVTVTATLTSAGTVQPGRAVTLWYRSGTTWNPSATATTSTAGTAQFTTTPAASGAYQVRFAGAGAYTASTSAELPVNVQQAAALTLDLPASVSYGSTVTATGRLTSNGAPVAGRVLQLWRGTGADAVLVGTSASTDATGTATVTFPATVTGTYQLGATATGDLAAAMSPAAALTAVRATALTSTLSTTSASYGQPVTVTGTLTSTSPGATGPLPGATVELWATDAADVRTRVTTGVTTSPGTATFTVTPVQESTYELVYPGTAGATGSRSTATTVTVTRATTASLTLTSKVAWNTSSTVTGTLAWAGTSTGVAGQAVELWGMPEGKAWAKAAAATTSATGQAVFAVTVAGNTTYQLRYAGAPVGAVTAQPANSAATAQYAVRPTTAVTRAASATLSYGAGTTVTGTLSWAGTTSPLAGQGVELWAYTGGAWTKVATGTTTSTGTSTWAVKPLRGTTYQVRYAGNTVISPVMTGPSTSTNVAVKVVRGTAATIKVSSARVTYGTAVTVTGTLSWAGTTTRLAGQPVELWGYTAGKWARISTGTTTSTGTVTWTHKPTYNTTYQLRYAGNRVIADVTTGAAPAVSVTTKVVAKVSLVTPTKVRYYTTYTLKGGISPAVSGRTIAIVVNGRVVTTATTNTYGQYTAKVKFPKGYSTVYANVATHPYNDGSNSTSYRVYSY